MDLMSSVAATAMNMSAASIAMDYSTAVTKKVMDTQELAGQELMEMLPAKGQFVDTYA